MKKVTKPAPKLTNKKYSQKIKEPRLTRNSYVSKKINAKDAFNLDNTSDLPEIVKNKLGVTPMRGAVQHIFSELFEMKDKLSIDEMQVGVYRVFGLEKPREWITGSLSTLKGKGLIKNVPGEAGVYQLVK